MTNWAIPQEVLSAVFVNSSTPVQGPVIDLGEVRDSFVAQYNVSGFIGSGTIAVDVYGSLDGVTWYLVINLAGGVGADFQGANALGPDGLFSPALPARYLQAASSVVAGTSTATVTTWVAAGNS